MNCTFSDPVDYQGNTPSSSLDIFQFRQMDCVVDWPSPATPSAQTSSTSASLVTAYGEFARVSIISFALVIFLLGVLVFLNVFKR